MTENGLVLLYYLRQSANFISVFCHVICIRLMQSVLLKKMGVWFAWHLMKWFIMEHINPLVYMT